MPILNTNQKLDVSLLISQSHEHTKPAQRLVTPSPSRPITRTLRDGLAVVVPLDLHVGVIDRGQGSLQMGRLALHQRGVLQGPTEHGLLILRHRLGDRP